jgi:hypothetical protein
MNELEILNWHLKLGRQAKLKKVSIFKVIKQAKRKTGFDYWIGEKEEEYPFIS